MRVKLNIPLTFSTYKAKIRSNVAKHGYFFILPGHRNLSTSNLYRVEAYVHTDDDLGAPTFEPHPPIYFKRPMKLINVDAREEAFSPLHAATTTIAIHLHDDRQGGKADAAFILLRNQLTLVVNSSKIPRHPLITALQGKIPIITVSQLFEEDEA